MRRGNELGNPIVLWEIGTLLAEFLAANGGRIVLYTVTIEVLGAGAVEATQLATTKKQRNRDKCRDQYVDCTDSRLAQDLGKHAGDSRCSLCRDICEVQGKWPSWAPVGSCDYKNYRPASN